MYTVNVLYIHVRILYNIRSIYNIHVHVLYYRHVYILKFYTYVRTYVRTYIHTYIHTRT